MTNATDALRDVIAFLLGEAPLEGRWFGDDATFVDGQYRQRFWWRKRLQAAFAALATPAGSASGEVQRYFRGEYGMVAAGPEYPHRDGDTYWVAEQDYAALQAEVARLRSALMDCLRATNVARDTIQPITVAQLKLHGLNPNTADMLDAAAINAIAALHQRKDSAE